MILVVAVEGEIAEIKEAAVEAPEEAPAVEVEVEAQADPTPTAKKVIESTVKESHFSAEIVETLKAEIESLKTELAAIKEVEVKEVVELSAQPLTHNPDAKQNVEKILFSQNRQMTTFDRVMNKIAN